MAVRSPAERKTLVSDEVVALEQQYLLQNYSRYPVVVQRGKGCYVYSAEGKRYLDLISGIGVNALGHAHPRILRVLRQQAGLLIHSSNLYYHPYQGRLARKLVEMSGLARCFFCNSGTEAVEAALKMARSHGRRIHQEKFEILAVENSFHGRTIGALSVTGQPKYRESFEPLLPGVRFVPVGDEAALEQAFSERTSAMILEWIQGEGGVYPLPLEFIRKARELCDRYDALLIFDEIQCGLGRVGKYFAYQMPDSPIQPDIVVVAKPLACGLPLGAVLANEKAASTIGPGMHGTTFGGGALACRVALEFLDILEGLLTDIHQVGSCLKLELAELQRHFSFIREVRGYGLMIGMELDMPGKQIVLDGLEAGLLLNCTHERVLRFLPPYIITEAEVDRAVNMLKRLLKKADRPPAASQAT